MGETLRSETVTQPGASSRSHSAMRTDSFGPAWFAGQTRHQVRRKRISVLRMATLRMIKAIWAPIEDGDKKKPPRTRIRGG